MTETERPLVTFALFAFNQENYIREAIIGAFSQTYSPLQIILSDDRSTDRTFEIMREMASDYTGSAWVVVRRNPSNFGLTSHITHVMEVAASELVVVAAGDDVSLPERVEILARNWLSTGRQSGGYYSAMYEANAEMQQTGFLYKGSPQQIKGLTRKFVSSSHSVFGASAAWTKDLFERFGPLLPQLVNEDAVLPMRAAALGSVNYTDVPLVLYRANMGLASNSSNGVRPNRRAMYVPSVLIRNYIVFLQKSADLKTIGAEKTLINAAITRRAEYLFRYRLFNKSKGLSKRKLSYFIKRCRFSWISKEVLKRLFPSCINAEEAIQNIVFRVFR